MMRDETEITMMGLVCTGFIRMKFEPVVAGCQSDLMESSVRSLYG